MVEWVGRTGAYGVFLLRGQPGTASDVRKVTAFIVPRPGRTDGPSVIADNFQPDAAGRRALAWAGAACLDLVTPGQMGVALAVSLLGNHDRSALRALLHVRERFSELRQARDWARVLQGSEIYLQIDGKVGLIEDDSFFGAAVVAILLALAQLSPSVQPALPPLLVQRLVDAAADPVRSRRVISVSPLGLLALLRPVGGEAAKIEAVRQWGGNGIELPQLRAPLVDGSRGNAPVATPPSPAAVTPPQVRQAAGPVAVHRSLHVCEMVLCLGGLWSRWSFASNTILLTILLTLVLARSCLLQTATISSVHAVRAGQELIAAGSHMRGRALGLDVLVVQVKANSYRPPLRVEVEAARRDGVEIGLFAGKGSFQRRLTVPVGADSEVWIRYWRNEVGAFDLPDLALISVRTFYGRLLDRRVLILASEHWGRAEDSAARH